MREPIIHSDPVIYYAHCMSWYDTPAETLDIDELSKHGRVINPNTDEFKHRVERAKRYAEPIMQIFADYIRDYVDVVAFRPLLDGRVGAGVFREVLEGAIWQKGIWRLEGKGITISVNKCVTRGSINFSTLMTVAQTRDVVERKLL